MVASYYGIAHYTMARSWAQGVLRRGARRIATSPGAMLRRRAPRPGGSTRRRLHRRPDRKRVRVELPGRVRLHRADRRAGAAPSGLLASASGTGPRCARRSRALKRHRAAPWAGTALVALALLALPFALAAAGTTWVRITNLAILFVLLSLGLNIVVGFAGLLDLGYVAFYAVGAYVYALLASPHFGIHWPFWAILPIGAAVAASSAC